MISLALATALRDHGLLWTPTEGDRFVLPDRQLAGEVFTLSDMVLEVRRIDRARLLAARHAEYWPLDDIDPATAVWLPHEGQLRERLGDAFLSLVRLDDGWRCTCRLRGQLVEHEHTDPSEAYGLALLELLRDGP